MKTSVHYKDWPLCKSKSMWLQRNLRHVSFINKYTLSDTKKIVTAAFDKSLKLLSVSLFVIFSILDKKI
jgi:hypothetical protein